MKFLFYIIAGLLIMSLFTVSGYAVSTDCFNGTLFYVWQLNDVFSCIEDRLDTLENNPSGGEANTASNIGTSGRGIFSSKVGVDLQFKKLISSNNVTLGITDNGTNIIFVPSAGSESTICNNLGTNGIIVCTGGNINLRRFISANNATLSIQANSTNVILENKSPDDTVCANVGSGSQVYKDGECNFRSIIGSADISVSQQTNTITIDFNGTSGGSDNLIGQSGGQTYLSLAKTNIGTSYVSIYSTIFDQENFISVDLHNATYVRAIFLWDYVGTGTQQVRWTPANATTTQIFESATFTSDCNPCITSWNVIPASVADRDILFNWQGKSTVAGDDPIAKGFQIQIK